MARKKTENDDVNKLLPEARIPKPEKEGRAMIDDLDHLKIIGPPPNPAFVRSIREFGVLQPIWLQFKAADTVAITNTVLRAGRRRLAAARIINEEIAKDGGPMLLVPYIVFGHDQVNPHVLTVIENAMRRDNPVSELDAIEAMVRGGSSHEDIAAATGLTQPQLTARLRLSRLLPPLRKLMAKGEIPSTVAERVASLPESLQLKVHEMIKEHGKVSMQDVAALRKVEIAKAAGNLPDSMFHDPALDWRADAEADLNALVAKLKGRGAPSKVIIAVESIIPVVQKTKEATGGKVS